MNAGIMGIVLPMASTFARTAIRGAHGSGPGARGAEQKILRRMSGPNILIQGRPRIGPRRESRPLTAPGASQWQFRRMAPPGTNGGNDASPCEPQRISFPSRPSHRSGLRRRAASRDRGPRAAPQDGPDAEAQRRALSGCPACKAGVRLKSHLRRFRFPAPRFRHVRGQASLDWRHWRGARHMANGQ